MFLGHELDRFFGRAVQTLTPYLGDLVCIGGCANALYRYHPLAQPLQWDYIGTTDMDLAVPAALPVKSAAPVVDLMRAAGFKELNFGCGNKAVIKYVPVEASPIDLEFLCPLSGIRGGRTRSPASYAVQTGLLAQPLRYLELLLCRPWEVDLGRIPELVALRGISVRVPNPAAYVVQKILIRDEGRSAAAREKDCFYIYEVSGVFRDALASLRGEFENLAPCPPKWKRRFSDGAKRLFRDANAEGPLSAARVFADSGRSVVGGAGLTSEIVAASVNRLLDHMLG